MTTPIWDTTGNPFVDMGQEMMAALAGMYSARELTSENVKTLLPRLTKLYLQEGWSKSLFVIFPNSRVNNPSIKNKMKAYSDLLEGWFTKLSTDNQSIGVCALSGKPAHLKVSKTYLPMSDFEGGNFQSGNDSGMLLNAGVALALHFFPLGAVKIGKMVALPHFANDDTQFFWAKNCKKHLIQSEMLTKQGLNDFGISRSTNAFFHLVQLILSEYRDEDIPDTSVTLYLFNNFNQVDYKSAVELHYMPLSVFKFIHAAMGASTERAWRTVVRRGYLYAKEDDPDEKIVNYSNEVYESLLAGRSISRFFVVVRERRAAVRGHAGWLLYSSYLREVKGMDQRRLDSLRDLGDRLAPLVREKRRRLLALERSKSKGELTGVLYRLAKDALLVQEKPLITFEQLVGDVFPHDVAYSDWREVKYLLLFRIYEQLHEELKNDLEYLESEDHSEAPEEDNE